MGDRPVQVAIAKLQHVDVIRCPRNPVNERADLLVERGHTFRHLLDLLPRLFEQGRGVTLPLVLYGAWQFFVMVRALD